MERLLNNLKSFVLGAVAVSYAIYGIITGVIYFPLAKNIEHWALSRYEDFVVFWLVEAFMFYFGILGVKKGLITSGPESNLEPLTFPDINAYNNFKHVEKVLGTAPGIWGVVGFLFAFPFWFIVDYGFSATSNGCNFCVIDEDWSNLLLASALILLPVLFYKLSFKLILNSYINKEMITANHIKYMRSPTRSGKKSDDFDIDFQSDSSDSDGGGCGGGD